MKKVFIIRKYVLASSIQEAIKKERKQQPDDVFLDEVHRTKLLDSLEEKPKALGFSNKNKK